MKLLIMRIEDFLTALWWWILGSVCTVLACVIVWSLVDEFDGSAVIELLTVTAPDALIAVAERPYGWLILFGLYCLIGLVVEPDRTTEAEEKAEERRDKAKTDRAALKQKLLNERKDR